MSINWYAENFFNNSPVAPLADQMMTGTLVDLADAARRAERNSLNRTWAYFDASVSFAMTAITSAIRFVRDVVFAILLAPTWLVSDAGRKQCKAFMLRAVIDLTGALLGVAGTFYPPLVSDIVHYVLDKHVSEENKHELRERLKMIYWETNCRLQGLNEINNKLMS